MLWLTSMIAVFFLPFLYLAVLARLVGRISTQTLTTLLVVAAFLWAIAAAFWGQVRPHAG